MDNQQEQVLDSSREQKQKTGKQSRMRLLFFALVFYPSV